MQPADPLFDRRSAIKGVVVATLSMGTLACTLYSPYVDIYLRIALACLALGITAFAACVNLHLFASGGGVVNVQNADNVTQNNPAPTPKPRDAKGHYAKATTHLDTVADS